MLTLFVKAVSLLYLGHIHMGNMKLKKLHNYLKLYDIVNFFLNYQDFYQNYINISSLISGTQKQVKFSVYGNKSMHS